MRLRLFLPVLALCAACCAVAQAPPGAEQARPAPPETPPEIRAYNQANRIADPAKKIEALEKFERDFPEADQVQQARQAVFSTLIKKFPDETSRIRKQAGKLYGGAARAQKGRVADQIASGLLDAGVLPGDAERYATRGLHALNQRKYLAGQRAGYARRKAKPPAEEDLVKRFQEMRAARLGTLGRAYYKLGNTAKARKLLEESWEADRDQPPVAAALGEIAAAQGQDTKALEYLVAARLSGRGGAEATATLESVYRKINSGSLEGLDFMLDNAYRTRYPNPVGAGRYEPSPNRSDRVVLAEVFTGSGCGPCAGADVAFDAALERYARKDVAVLMYHVHVPRPDPMTNSGTQARFKFYGVRGVPTYAIDGQSIERGGGARDSAKSIYGYFSPAIEADLEAPAEAVLTLDARLTGNTVRVRAAADEIRAKSKDLVLHIALVEKQIRYTGENGIRFHPMVVRAMAGADGPGFALTAPTGFEQIFDLDKVSAALRKHLDEYEAAGHRGEAFQFSEKKDAIDRGNLGVVVFVQDAKTRRVLQAAWVDLGAAKPAPTENE